MVQVEYFNRPFDESDHPRAEDGKFAETSGAKSDAQSGIDKSDAPSRVATEEKQSRKPEGISELTKAMDAHSRARRAFAKAMASEHGEAHPPDTAATEKALSEAQQRFPRAVLWLEADAIGDRMGMSSTGWLARQAAKKAKAILEAGGDIEEARRALDDFDADVD